VCPVNAMRQKLGNDKISNKIKHLAKIEKSEKTWQGVCNRAYTKQRSNTAKTGLAHWGPPT